MAALFIALVSQTMIHDEISDKFGCRFDAGASLLLLATTADPMRNNFSMFSVSLMKINESLIFKGFNF
jgi:hypothetical protein